MTENYNYKNILDISKNAQKEWAELGHAQRAKSLSYFRKKIISDMDLWIEAIESDINKTPLEILGGDIWFTAEMIYYYEQNAAKILKPRKAKKSPLFFNDCEFWEYSLPLGVVLVISPWNYPLQLALVPVFTALFAGNSVILKPSEFCAATNELIKNLFSSNTDIPKGLIQIIEGDGTIAQKLIENKPDKIFFTGSSFNGEKVQRLATQLHIPSTLELGGKDAMIVFKDANFERSLQAALYGAYSNSGQVCVGVKIILVEESLYEEFLNKFSALSSQLTLPHLARSQEVDVALSYLDEALKMGAVLHTPLKNHDKYLQPLVLSKVPEKSKLLTEEVFAPIVCVESFNSENDLVSRLNRCDFALSSSVWSKDINKAKKIALRLPTGSTAINDVIRNIANPDSSFGGEKRSGHGRYHGPEGLLSLTKRFSLMVHSGNKNHEKHWFPYKPKITKQLKYILKKMHSNWFWNFIVRNFLLIPIVLGTFSLKAIENMNLKIEVKGIKQSKGTMAYCLFNNKEGFPGDNSKAFRSGFINIHEENTDLNFTINNIPPGEYAVSVFQDLNNDQKLNKNFLGIPKEPVGASQNPKSRLGPPRYQQSRFILSQDQQSISIDLVE